MPSEINSRRSWSRVAFGLSRDPFGLATALALVVALISCSCASFPRTAPPALAAEQETLASLDAFGTLLVVAGLPVTAIPEGRGLSPEQAGMLRRYFAILPPLPQHYAPRFVADELLRFVEDKGASFSRRELSSLVQEYRNLYVLTPQGYLAAALTGGPTYCVSALQVSQTSAGVGGFELGRYYTNSGVNWPQTAAPNLDRD